jgi:hypothetical protein
LHHLHELGVTEVHGLTDTPDDFAALKVLEGIIGEIRDW